MGTEIVPTLLTAFLEIRLISHLEKQKKARQRRGVFPSFAYLEYTSQSLKDVRRVLPDTHHLGFAQIPDFRGRKVKLSGCNKRENRHGRTKTADG